MISVCMATYNGANFIKEQLDSILCQLSYNDEVIISDDGSTDETVNIILALKDKRIKILHHKHGNINVVSSISHYYATMNFENALIESKGDFVFLSDQDDIWYPQKTKTLVAELNNYDLVMSSYKTMDSKGELLDYKSRKHVSNSILRNLIYHPFVGCCMAFRKEVLRYALPFPKKLVMHDNWIGLIASLKGRIKYIDEPLILYRRHGNNIVQTLGVSPNSIIFKITYRLYLFLFLVVRYVKTIFQ
jgi:glycosyltransferase involved in cell wall biosynthesis